MKIILFWLGITCLLVPASGGTVAPDAAQVWSDARLRQAVIEFGKKETGNSAITDADLLAVYPKLEHLQKQTRETSELHRYITFTLAYFGRDYRRNLRRLSQPIELWMKGDRRWSRYLISGEEDPLLDIPVLLSRLYRHRHDPAILQMLFSWRLDGGPAEILDSERIQFLLEEPLAVLKTVHDSPSMTENVVQTLGYYANPTEYRQALTRMKRASRRASPQVRRHTLDLVRKVATRRRHYHPSER